MGDLACSETVVAIAQRGTDGCAKLAVFGNVEAHVVELLHGIIDLTTLGQQREVANEHKIFDAAFQTAQDGARAHGLQHHVDESDGDVFARGIGFGVAEEARRGAHRQSGKRMGADVANEQIDFRDVAGLSQFGHLFDIVGLEHDATQPLQGAAANARTTDVADVIAVAFHETGARAHAHDNHLLQPAFVACPQSVGDKFLRFGRGQPVDVFVNIGRTYSRDHHLRHIAQLDAIVVQIFSEGAIKRRDGVGGSDSERIEHGSFGVDTHDFGGADTHINTDDDTRMGVFCGIMHDVRALCLRTQRLRR